MDIFVAYPVASVSAALSFALVLAMAIPGRFGQAARNMISHPIPATQNYLPAFDTLRGFAALLVAVGHLWYFAYPATAPIQWDFPWIAYGAKAVPMFTMLSGFLIYRSVRHAETAEQVRDFLYRRFFRIYPMYFVSVVLMFLLGQLHAPLEGYGRFSYLLSELFMLRVLDAPFYANPATWSLYVEVLFYFLIPLYVFLVPRQRVVSVTAVLLAVFVVADQWTRPAGGGLPVQWHYSEFYLWKYFLGGIFVSELALRKPPSPRAAGAVLLAGLIWLLLDLQGPDYDVFVRLGLAVHNQSEYTIGLGFAFALVMYGIRAQGLASGLLSLFPLRYIGIVSYSLFILHPAYLAMNFPELHYFRPPPNEIWKTYPVMPSWFFGFVFLFGLTIWATAGFILVERPALAVGKRWLNRRRAATRSEPSALVAPASGTHKVATSE